ncbi:MAG: uracil-DNA glycosylase [Gammaproteobacteria bacterium]|nr:uracil-DNA glycosylase [Gammaproteobacteria bacterium]
MSTDSRTDPRAIQLDASWRHLLQAEFDAVYMQQLRQFLLQEKQQGKHIYPPGPEIFHALNVTSFDKVRVVILGQDPYRGPGQAHGLCFSVKRGIPVPPSLLNIYKELAADLDCLQPDHGCLDYWAEQGVLLLNAVLTVEAARAASHQGKGWERFTDRIIEHLNSQRNNLVFMLWGAYAQRKGAMIDRQRHLVLESTHPSPLSAHRGFFGNHHFSRCNAYLLAHDISPIDWQLPALKP